MALQIEDGGGTGRLVKVDDEGQLKVVSESQSLQHHVSKNEGNAYQVIGDFTAINNSTHTILHLKNTDTTKQLVITYMRMQVLDQAGGTAFPAAASRFELGFGRTYSSGGTAVTPVNVNATSGNVASVTAYDNNPTMAGSFTEIDRYYPTAEGDAVTYNKEGSIILGLNDTFEIRIVSDHTSGVAYARITFLML